MKINLKIKKRYKEINYILKLHLLVRIYLKNKFSTSIKKYILYIFKNYLIIIFF
jgi:hypothetical protein